MSNIALFLSKYKPLLHPYRDSTMLMSLYMANRRGALTFVETGTARKDGDFYGDGQSTYILGDYCKTILNNEGKIWTCDIIEENIDMCKKVTKEFSDNIEYVVSDSLLFLKGFENKIDYLYLDSFDSSTGQEEEAALHNFEELKLALPNTHESTIIVIDDYHINGKKGKGKYSVPYLIDNGWKLANSTGFQAVLVRK